MVGMPLTDDVEFRRRSRKRETASAERRRQIVDAAFEAFAESGFNGASMRDIAVRAGLSHTGLMHHFPDKIGLLEAVLDKHISQTAQTFDLENNDGETFVRNMVRIMERNVTIPGLVALYCTVAAEAATSTHPAHGYFAQWFATVRARIAEAFADLDARGLFTGHGMTPELAAVHVAAVSDGLQLQWIVAPDQVDLPGGVRSLLSVYTDLDLTETKSVRG
jgi:AcrR family transcriptional regulator